MLVNIGLILKKFKNPEINTNQGNDLTLINETMIIIIYINMFFIKKIKIMNKFIKK